MLIPSPYSAPSFCYVTDINAVIADNVAARLDMASGPNGGLVQRKYLEEEAHTTLGRTSLNDQYETLGVLETAVPKQIGDVIVLDDVTTTGQQLRSIVHVLNGMDIGERYMGVAVGQTQRG